MLISIKNKKSSIIKGLTLLLACVTLFTLVLTGCTGDDALAAAEKAQSAADAAMTAAEEAMTAAEAAKLQADAAKADAALAQATANEAATMEEVATSIQTQLANFATISQLETELANYTKTSGIVAMLVDYAKTSDLVDYAKTSELTAQLALYTKNDELASKLADYFTSSEVQAKLADYAKQDDFTALSGEVATILADYAKNSDLDDYYTSNEIITMLANYSTTSDIQTLLADYAKKGELDTLLTEYAKTADITLTLNDYATISLLNNMLGNYALQTSIADMMTNTAFQSFVTGYDDATALAVATYMKIDTVIEDMCANADLYPSTNLVITIKELTEYKYEVLRTLNQDDVDAIIDAAQIVIDASKSYPQIAYEAYLAVDELIYPVVGDTYSSQDQMDAFLAAITINTGDVTRDAIIMTAIRAYAVDDTTTIDLEATYNTYESTWLYIKNFGDVTAPALNTAIDAIDNDYLTITLDQTARYADFKTDVEAAYSIYTGVLMDISVGQPNSRLVPNLQKLIDAKAYKETLVLREADPADYIARIDTLLGSTGWTASNKVLFNTFKTSADATGNIALLKADVEAWAVANGVTNIATLITNYPDLVAAYDYAEVQYNAYVDFTTNVKPAIETANAATLALSNESLFVNAKALYDTWAAGDVDDINLNFIYVDPMKTTFTTGLARIAVLNSAKADAVVINDYIATYATQDITIHTKSALITYWENTIRDGWCATYAIPCDSSAALYIEENYYLVNITELNTYMDQSQQLIDEVILKGQNFVNAVKAIPGYDETIANCQANLYSLPQINAALVLYNTWSDENIITDLMFEGLAQEVADHYAIWTKLAVQYDAILSQAQTDGTPVADAIDAIGAVGIYSGDVIVNARTLYDAWAAIYIPNGTTGIDANMATAIADKLAILTQAEETFANAKSVKDAETVNVIALIDAIPTDITTFDFAAIDAARAAYDTWHANIDDTKFDYVVTNYSDLTNAETAKADLIALSDDANVKIDALAALTILADEETTNTYNNAIIDAMNAVDAFVNANGGSNDVIYISEAQNQVITDASIAYQTFLFNAYKNSKLVELQAIYDAECADVANIAFVDQFTVAYNNQRQRLNDVEERLYNGMAAENEMDRLVTEFQSQIDSIIAG